MLSSSLIDDNYMSKLVLQSIWHLNRSEICRCGKRGRIEFNYGLYHSHCPSDYMGSKCIYCRPDMCDDNDFYIDTEWDGESYRRAHRIEFFTEDAAKDVFHWLGVVPQNVKETIHDHIYKHKL